MPGTYCAADLAHATGQVPTPDSPVYQTERLFFTSDAANWLEISTAHWPGCKLWFWGYGNYQYGWQPIGGVNLGGGAGQNHQMKVERTADGVHWQYTIDASGLAPQIVWPDAGLLVAAGLESYRSGQVVHGQDPPPAGWPVVTPQMCGHYGAANNIWIAAENSSC